jgi:hypothetical protein
MSWIDIANNEVITWNDLQIAIYSEIFEQLLPVPPSGTSGLRCIRRELIQSYVNIQSAPLSGVSNNELVVKSQVVAAQATYYRLIGCFDQQYYYTKTPPGPVPTTGQRYKSDAGSGIFFYFTWDGTSFFGDRPSNYYAGLVTDGRFIGCPL